MCALSKIEYNFISMRLIWWEFVRYTNHRHRCTRNIQLHCTFINYVRVFWNCTLNSKYMAFFIFLCPIWKSTKCCHYSHIYCMYIWYIDWYASQCWLCVIVYHTHEHRTPASKCSTARLYAVLLGKLFNISWAWNRQEVECAQRSVHCL